MSEHAIIRTLKIFIILGISLILLGHFLLASSYLTDEFGITGIIISATCIAVGVLFSLPTKIYLTIMLMKMEEKTSGTSKS
ncbi:hypothetical protein [Pseudoalteromonas sp.]|uniref:hypothetical protein n=1 Tax=Pseudoalteromonas sp. TaxID=53249 RepID=UPI003F9E7FDD